MGHWVHYSCSCISGIHDRFTSFLCERVKAAATAPVSTWWCTHMDLVFLGLSFFQTWLRLSLDQGGRGSLELLSVLPITIRFSQFEFPHGLWFRVFFLFFFLPAAESSTEVSSSPKQIGQVIRTVSVLPILYCGHGMSEGGGGRCMQRSANLCFACLLLNYLQMCHSVHNQIQNW